MEIWWHGAKGVKGVKGAKGVKGVPWSRGAMWPWWHGAMEPSPILRSLPSWVGGSATHFNPPVDLRSTTAYSEPHSALRQCLEICL